MQSTYYIYILECADGTLYTGISTDPKRRLAEHNAGIGAKYTRSRLPVKLVYQEAAERSEEDPSGRSAALKRELQIKRLTRIQKLALINR